MSEIKAFVSSIPVWALMDTAEVDVGDGLFNETNSTELHG